MSITNFTQFLDYAQFIDTFIDQDVPTSKQEKATVAVNMAPASTAANVDQSTANASTPGNSGY